MKTLNIKQLKAGMAAIFAFGAMALTVSGTAKPAAADVRWGVDIHLGQPYHGYYHGPVYYHPGYRDWRWERARIERARWEHERWERERWQRLRWEREHRYYGGYRHYRR